MATQQERIAVLETKVDNLKETVTENHNKLIKQLDDYREENAKDHAKVMAMLDDLMLWKNKWVWVGGGILTVLSLVFGHLETIVKLIHAS
jgi:hypothetical protein